MDRPVRSNRQRMPDLPPRSNVEDKVDLNNKSSSQFSSATPLCICPTCDKVLGSMRSLYGHCGRMHKTAVNQERIKYMCPFDESDKVFDSITQLEQYVSKNHPGCTLATTLTENLTQDSSSKPKPPSKPKSKSSPTAPSTESPAELKRTTRYQKDTKASSKQILCKCPYCDKILHPTGVVGHVGRVHSGQLDGSIAKLEWEKQFE